VVAVQAEAQVVGHPIAGGIVEMEDLPRAIVGGVVFHVEAVGGLQRQLGAFGGQSGEGDQRLVGVEVGAGGGQPLGIVLG
ncbi:hypothetical protein QMN71_23135, partial [Escherichia coli]